MKPLTKNQREAVAGLTHYAGRTVDVLTSGYTANVNPEFVRAAVGTFSASALRGLEARGLVKVESSFWKGARVTVLPAIEGAGD